MRAWKWRQILSPLKLIGTLRLFGAVMAGYLIATLIPLGFGTIARSWLISRSDQLKLPAELATVALDRITDGVVFAFLVPIALLAVAFADPTGSIRTGLVWSGAGSLVFFVLLGCALWAYKRGILRASCGRSRVTANRRAYWINSRRWPLLFGRKLPFEQPRATS